jgi:hypothetical protein
MATPNSPQSTDGSQFKDFDGRDAIVLERVAEKLARFGQQVGVTPEEMISLPSGSSRSLPRSLREPRRRAATTDNPATRRREMANLCHGFLLRYSR